MAFRIMGWPSRATVARVVGVLLLLALAGCGRKHVLMWKAQSRGSTVYLLGAVPMKEGDLGTFDPRIESAFESSDALVLEYRVDVGNAKENEDAVREAAMLPHGESLRDHLAPEVEQRLGTYLASTGASLEKVQAFQPWMVGALIMAEKRKQLGYPSARLIDRHFADVAGGKSITYMLPVQEEISLYQDLGSAALSEFVTLALDAADGLMESRGAVYEKAWAKGDPGPIAAMESRALRDYPRCEREIRSARLKLFLASVTALFGNAGTSFVVVNADDLVLDDGIPAVLAARGFDVVQM